MLELFFSGFHRLPVQTILASITPITAVEKAAEVANRITPRGIRCCTHHPKANDACEKTASPSPGAKNKAHGEFEVGVKSFNCTSRHAFLLLERYQCHLCRTCLWNYSQIAI
ncbi:hypothetical protein TNIN_306011 [Trichonephila inaurata madagascariensis]|uniref:Uncharacterized protein n=1 Tax=Trichonephila inaurata madagascariensis TaxID=2747483 RepID=A0A8X6I8X8_9ARAC|nr:hypothetical protein TNIN_306011 [Trichonephila inaurata madagascariensis]